MGRFEGAVGKVELSIQTTSLRSEWSVWLHNSLNFAVILVLVCLREFEFVRHRTKMKREMIWSVSFNKSIGGVFEKIVQDVKGTY